MSSRDTETAMQDVALKQEESGDSTDMEPEEESKSNKTPLNAKNYLNVSAYLLNTIFTYGVGTAGWFGAGDTGDISDKYQTLITPKSAAFSIWALIFAAQAVFVVAQMFPRYRAMPLVQKGVGYWYLVVCAFQISWNFAFGFESFIASLVIIIFVWTGLLAIVTSQYYVHKREQLAGEKHTLDQFWLLRFPFAIHCGWITAATTLNVNLVAVKLNATAATQLAIGIVTLAYLHAVAVWVTFGLKRPNFTIAGVLAWAFGWIYAELGNPMPSILETFGSDTVNGVRYAALAVSIIIVGQVVTRVTMDVIQCFMKKRHSGSELSSEKQELKSDEEKGIVDAKVH